MAASAPPTPDFLHWKPYGAFTGSRTPKTEPAASEPSETEALPPAAAGSLYRSAPLKDVEPPEPGENTGPAAQKRQQEAVAGIDAPSRTRGPAAGRFGVPSPAPGTGRRRPATWCRRNVGQLGLICVT